MVDAELEAVRRRIRSLDEKLITLAAERVALARRVGDIKRADRRPTVDYGQERRVLESARETAAAHDLEPALAEELLARLIRAAVTAQERDNLAHAAHGAGKTAVLPGGGGRMGRWMNRFLQDQGYQVAVLDPQASAAESERARQLLPTAELVVCATPPRTTAELYESWLEEPPAGVVVDLASIKTPLLEAIRRLQRAGARVASIHPMFGPSTVLLRGADVVVCDTGDDRAMAAVEELFAPTTAHLVRLPLVDHDRMMADLLSLAHAAAIAVALALPESEHPVRSTTLAALEGLASAVVRESPDVYFEIQARNPHSLAAVEKLRAAVEMIVTVVRGGDVEDFRSLMREGRRRTRGLEGASQSPRRSG